MCDWRDIFPVSLRPPSQLLTLFGSWATNGPMRAILFVPDQTCDPPDPAWICMRMDLEFGSLRKFTRVYILGKILLPLLWALSWICPQRGFFRGIIIFLLLCNALSQMYWLKRTPIYYPVFHGSGVWVWLNWVLCSVCYQDETKEVARAANSPEAWGALPSSVVVGRIRLLVMVGLKSCFLAQCLSAPSGHSQVRTLQPSHTMVASKPAW